MSDVRPAAQPGERTCVTAGCHNEGAPVAAVQCAVCGQSTWTVPPADGVGSPWHPPVTSGLSAGEILGRLVFGGFWSLVALAALAAAGILLTHGERITGLGSLGISGLAALYARYLYRGGRWRILFW